MKFQSAFDKIKSLESSVDKLKSRVMDLTIASPSPDDIAAAVNKTEELAVELRTIKRQILAFIDADREAQEIFFAITECTGVGEMLICSKSRRAEYVTARAIFCHHARRAGLSYPQIAQVINRDHSTAMHLCKKYRQRCEYEPQFKATADAVAKALARPKTNFSTSKQE